MSNVVKRKKESSKCKLRSMGDHREFLRRITKTLYYGQLPMLPCLSLPVTEISCMAWSEGQRGRSVRRLHADAAARLAHSACVSPCTLVLALLYLERLNNTNPQYVERTEPHDLFLISLMVGNKFLQDDGEDEEVMCGEWATAAKMNLHQLHKLELDFLNAIDWSVYVSEESFKERLRWLERQVALRQAQLNGFFTYTDLAVTCDAELLNSLLKSIYLGCISATLTYIAGILAIITSTWFITQAMNSHCQQPSLFISANPPKPLIAFNDTETLEMPDIDQKMCCTDWLTFQSADGARTEWCQRFPIDNRISVKPWWSRTSVLNWLYYSSLVNPMQRWLEKPNTDNKEVGPEVLYQNCNKNCMMLPTIKLFPIVASA